MNKAGKTYRWSDAELDTLRALSATTRVADLARITGRSKKSVLFQIRKLGLENLARRMWTLEEVAAIRAAGPEVKVRDLARQLGRTTLSVYQRSRSLDLPRRKYSRWTEEQLATLRAMAGSVPVERIAEATDKSARAVRWKAQQLGLSLRQKGSPALRRPRVDPRPERARENAPRKKRLRVEVASHIEWCKECGAPVSNWQQHFERVGHRRPAA